MKYEPTKLTKTKEIRTMTKSEEAVMYSEYHPKWSLIRRLILKRDKYCCAWCGAPQYAFIYRTGKNEDWEYAPEGHMVDEMHSFGYKVTKIILTIAHIDHNKDNNRFENLASLCQRCHLNHDRKQHAFNRKYGRNWKRNQTKLDL